ncbi:hypothetical protein CRENBAI_006149 [Crenichthys baileyi]|uniref:Gamma-tubulin complex component n=1 Tax=Crenichthys baileyi TaxID=28760 RepID=A0AAV9R3I1_9TELE
MEKTYSLQRAHINAMPASSTEDLRINWPYLFTQCGIYAHFGLLTDVNVMQVLERSIEQCGRVIVEYFRTQSSHHDVQAIVSQGLDGDLTFHVVQLLMAHFGNQIHTLCKWMISIESHVICQSIQPTFQSGLAAFFAVFYVFNLQYQDEVSQTLEFIQRRFIGINPDRGSKATRGKVMSKRTGKVVQKRPATVNPHVATLLKKLLDFEWDFV